MIEYMNIPVLVCVSLLGGGGFCYDSRLAIEKAVGYGWEKDFVIHLPFISFRNVRFRLDMVQ